MGILDRCKSTFLLAAKVFFAVVLVIGVLGCGSMDDFLAGDAGSGMESEQLIVVLYKDIRDPNCLSRSVFAADEVPAIRISGFGGKDVNYLVFETETPKYITGQTVHLNTDSAYYRPFPDIQPGVYKVTMAGRGVTRASCEFRVTN